MIQITNFQFLQYNINYNINQNIDEYKKTM